MKPGMLHFTGPGDRPNTRSSAACRALTCVLPGMLVAQGDLVGLGDVVGLDGLESCAHALAGLPQQLEGVGGGALPSSRRLRRPSSARGRWPGPVQCRQPWGQYRACTRSRSPGNSPAKAASYPNYILACTARYMTSPGAASSRHALPGRPGICRSECINLAAQRM
jgi:hypothetical protein